jgi:hypothetical protein
VNEELQQRLLSALDAAAEMLRATGDAASREAPLLVQEYLLWVVIRAYVEIAFPAVMAAMLGVGAWMFYRRIKVTGGIPESWHVAPAAILGIVAGGSLVGFFATAPGNIQDILKAKYAPRVLLVEKAAELAKGVVK